MAITYFVIDIDDVSCFVILEYIVKTSIVKTILLGSIKSLIVVKDIWSTKSHLILRISVVIIK